MPGMTTGAASLAAIGIYSADTYIGPCILVKFPILDLHLGAVAMIAAGCPLNFIVQSVIEPGVDFPLNLTCVGVLAPGILGSFARVTPGAVLRRDNGANGGFVLFKVVLADIDIGGAGGVTVQTGNVSAGVSAGRPVSNDTPAFFSMAVDTLLGIFGNAPVDAILF